MVKENSEQGRGIRRESAQRRPHRGVMFEQSLEEDEGPTWLSKGKAFQ